MKIQEVSDALADYPQMYSLVDQARDRVKAYMNSADRMHRDQYEELCKEIRALESGAYAYLQGIELDNVVRMSEAMLASADAAVLAVDQGDAAAALAAYEEAVYIVELMDLYRTYADEASVASASLRLNAVSDHNRQVVQRTWFMLVGVTCLLTTACLLTTSRLLYPIRFLTKLCGQTSLKSRELPPRPQYTQTETDLLVDSYYDMMQTIQQQLDEIERNQALQTALQEERKRRAENERLIATMRLDVFQSQINSHFLFNTLNLIAKMAYLEQAKSAQQATELVARYLRKTLEQFNRDVTLKEEFENLQDYIEITRLRYGDRIEFFCTCNVECENVMIPSMVLQPLVENAIKHGMSALPSGGWIRCAASMEEDVLHLSVTDNGTGIPPERIQALTQSLSREETGLDGHVGLINVYRRLSLRFPERVHHEISSLSMRHTRIEFSIDLGEGVRSGNMVP